MSLRTKALIALLFIAVLWGTAGVVAKVLLRELSPFVITFYRFAGAALLLSPFISPYRKPVRFWVRLIPLSLLNTCNVLLFYFGLTTTTAVAASIIGTATPLVTLLFSHYLIYEHSALKERIGILIGLIGTLIVIVLPAIERGQQLIGDIRGNILVLLALVAWTLYSVYSRKFISQQTYAPQDTAFMNFAVTGAVALVIALVLKQPFVTPQVLTVPYLATLLFAIVGITLITFTVFQWIVKHIKITTASVKDYIKLVVGIGLGVLLLHESFTFSYLLGTALVVTGVFIATGDRVTAKLLHALEKRGW